MFQSSSRFRLSELATATRFLALIAVTTPLPALAQSLSASPAPTATMAAYNPDLALEEISVTATRSEKPLSRTPSSISVINAATIEEQQAKNIKDVLRYEPGVTVRTGWRYAVFMKKPSYSLS